MLLLKNELWDHNRITACLLTIIFYSLHITDGSKWMCFSWRWILSYPDNIIDSNNARHLNLKSYMHLKQDPSEALSLCMFIGLCESSELLYTQKHWCHHKSILSINELTSSSAQLKSFSSLASCWQAIALGQKWTNALEAMVLSGARTFNFWENWILAQPKVCLCGLIIFAI